MLLIGRSHGRFFGPSGFFAVALLAAAPLGAQTVTTDKPDYFPGDVVVMTGVGWLPNEPITMLLTEYPAVDAPLSLVATADGTGAFLNTEYMVQANDIGISYTLTATGQVSGQVAQTTFLDSGIGAGALNSPSGSLSQTGPAYNSTHWQVQAGDTVMGMITGATDAVASPCGANGVNVFVKSSDFGNTALCGTLSGTTITFTWIVPAAACSTTIVAYNTEGNNTNNDLNPLGHGGATAGFAIVDASGSVLSCPVTTTTTTIPPTTTSTSSTSSSTSSSSSSTSSSSSSTSSTSSSSSSSSSTTSSTSTSTSVTSTTTADPSTTVTSTTVPSTSTSSSVTTSSSTSTSTSTTSSSSSSSTSSSSSSSTSTSTTPAGSTTTTTIACVPSGVEAGHCNDGTDNDCNGLIDCSDPACMPAICFGGTNHGQSCATAETQAACTTGGGMCQCPAIQKDPTIVKFGPPGAGHDLLTSHGRVTIPGPQLDVSRWRVAWLLSNDRGKIYNAELPAGALKANIRGTAFTYANPNAKTAGGIYKALVKITHRGTSYGYKVQAYGDMSAATDAHMALQFYVGNQPTPGIHAENWQRTSFGWKAHGFQ